MHTSLHPLCVLVIFYWLHQQNEVTGSATSLATATLYYQSSLVLKGVFKVSAVFHAHTPPRLSVRMNSQ